MSVPVSAPPARVSVAPFVVAIATLIAVAAGIAVIRDRRFGDPTANAEAFLNIESGKAMRRIALSYNALAADLYWVRAVQHFGRQHQQGAEHKYGLLFPLLDLTTSLDPRFNIAYRFGAIFLSEEGEAGAGRPDLAVELLRKGIEANPHRWEYFQDIGFIYYWRYHDYKKAAEWYDAGGRVPGAPWWLRNLAAVTLARGGDRSASRFMWQQILQGADNDWLRQQAALRLAQLDAMDQIETLQRLVAQFKERTGRQPASWQALQQEGLLRGVPIDSSGSPYTLDAQTGSVSLGPDSKLRPLPTEPPGSQASSS